MVKRSKKSITREGSESVQLRMGLAQINSVVGDIDGNLERVLHCCQQAAQKKVDLVLFPELALTGYPPEDLLLKPSFVHDNIAALDRLCKKLDYPDGGCGRVRGCA